MIPGAVRNLYPETSIRMEPDAIVARATAEYLSLCARFQSTGKPVDFDFRKHCVEWTARGDHLTHRLHRYPGRLTPYIPLFFLSVRGVAVAGGRLLDPFAGCGTVLVEAAVHPSHPMRPVGFEINPLARLIAKVKTTPLSQRAVNDAWKRVIARYQGDKSRAGLPQFPNKRHWFTKAVELRLARVLRAMNALRDPDLRDFFLVAASSVVRQVSLADPSVSVPVILDPSKYKKKAVRERVLKNLERRKDADVLLILSETICSNLKRVDALREAISQPQTGATIVGADARDFVTARYCSGGHLEKTDGTAIDGVDLILTSPPYANAQRYTRSLRLELFVLGYTVDGIEERDLDRLQVGTERVTEREWDQLHKPTGSTTADKVIAAVKKQDRYRAAIVGKYVRDMATVLANCHNALKPGGHAVLVIGNNIIRGRELDNASILSELGAALGFLPVLHIRNKIPSRGLLTKRHETASVITHEHVVVLRKPC